MSGPIHYVQKLKHLFMMAILKCYYLKFAKSFWPKNDLLLLHNYCAHNIPIVRTQIPEFVFLHIKSLRIHGHSSILLRCDMIGETECVANVTEHILQPIDLILNPPYLNLIARTKTRRQRPLKDKTTQQGNQQIIKTNN